MPEGVTVRGIPEVQAYLRNFPKQLVAGCFAKALARAAAVFEEALMETCPETDFSTSSEEEGHLIDALMDVITIDPNGQGGRLSIGFGKQGMKALWVEYGHRVVSHHSGKTLGEAKPNPFMRRAFSSAADLAIDAFVTSVQQWMSASR